MRFPPTKTVIKRVSRYATKGRTGLDYKLPAVALAGECVSEWVANPCDAAAIVDIKGPSASHRVGICKQRMAIVVQE